MTLRYAVIGAGLAGASAAWQLARRGEDVTLVEAAVPAGAAGSSHGSARIFRLAYADEFYVRLALDAEAAWTELESEVGAPIRTNTGGLDFGPRRDLPRIAQSLTAANVPFEQLGRDEASERWPHIRFDGEVIYQPDAGTIDAEAAVLAMVDLVTAAGGNVVLHNPVARVAEDGRGYRLTLGGGEDLLVDVVVIAVGAWLPEMLATLPLPPSAVSAFPALVVTQHQVFHFRFVGEPHEWPVFVNKGELQIYSLPGGRDVDFRAVKIAEHDGMPTTASARTGMIDPDSRDRITGYVRERLPTLHPTPFAEASCLYTSTPSEDFIIDRVGGIVIVSPCSGHGAKFAPLVGRIAADVAVGAAPAPSRFRLESHRSG